MTRSTVEQPPAEQSAADTLRGIARAHLPSDVAERWHALLRPGARLVPAAEGDAGTLYWLIRRRDLAERRFERAVLTWQCG
ncbi:DUF1963 domain-containing protein [Streptomyces sp. CA-181903]|uniref:DUF1963 domain-containing protein n=1 Tax=Streptomyces sp. CA-181903 TaxID=3240055 RepID=UPI003D91191E